MIIKKALSPLKGEITIPGDKSISHRSVMLGSLAKGDTHITGFLNGADCLSTIDCFRRMGIEIELSNSKTGGNIDDTYEVVVHGKGLYGLQKPDGILDVGNSGTTMRLISGILSGQKFGVELTGDGSIQKRPMKRVIEPLTQMGANIVSIPGNGCAPLRIEPGSLHGIHYQSPVASAQVKSCVLLAGLYADGVASVTEPVLSRDHTERMLRAFGADIETSANCCTDVDGASANSCSPGSEVSASSCSPGPEASASSCSSGPEASATCSITPCNELYAQDILVPGDISSAAYFIAAALLVPGSEVLIHNVGINPTRDGIIRVCKAMGGDITLLNERICSGEPVADLLVKSSFLHGVTVGGPIIPTMIDELPIVAVLAAFAEGQTIIKDAAELKVKESDRIAVMTENLKAMRCDITAADDGMIINGGAKVHGALIHSHLDHRIAMSFAVAALAADGETEIDHFECVNISYPTFAQDLSKLLN